MLREIRLRRLARDVRDIKRRMRVLEIRRAAEDVTIEHGGPIVMLPETVALLRQKAKVAKPRITSGATVEVDEIPGGAGKPIGARAEVALAPEGTSGGSAGGVHSHPANASECATPALPEVPPPLPSAVRAVPKPKAERIALPETSAMERRFVSSAMGPVGSSIADAGSFAEAKVYCGPCDHRVPTWFGADCITVGCPLKGACA